VRACRDSRERERNAALKLRHTTEREARSGKMRSPSTERARSDARGYRAAATEPPSDEKSRGESRAARPASGAERRPRDAPINGRFAIFFQWFLCVSCVSGDSRRLLLVTCGTAEQDLRNVNDPSAGSPTETLLRLLLPLNDQVWSSSRQHRQCRRIAAHQSEDLTKSFNR